MSSKNKSKNKNKARNKAVRNPKYNVISMRKNYNDNLEKLYNVFRKIRSSYARLNILRINNCEYFPAISLIDKRIPNALTYYDDQKTEIYDYINKALSKEKQSEFYDGYEEYYKCLLLFITPENTTIMFVNELFYLDFAGIYELQNAAKYSISLAKTFIEINECADSKAA